MNKKQEDQLIQMAFSETSPAEASRLSAFITGNDASATVAHSYQRMRDDLESLKEVPDDQMSNERLREAILKSGLISASGGSVLGLIWNRWLPTAVLAACAVVGTVWYIGQSGGSSVAEPSAKFDVGSVASRTTSNPKRILKAASPSLQVVAKRTPISTVKTALGRIGTTLVASHVRRSHSSQLGHFGTSGIVQVAVLDAHPLKFGRALAGQASQNFDLVRQGSLAKTKHTESVGVPIVFPGAAVIGHANEATLAFMSPASTQRSTSLSFRGNMRAKKATVAPARNTIILINQVGTDTAEANQATEVESSRNVLVGG